MNTKGDEKMEHITIISTYSEGGILKYILYTNKHKELKKADFENHKINANNINFNSIKNKFLQLNLN